MGEEIVFRCPKCGKHVGISQGAFFRSPSTAEDVLNGEYGKNAAENLKRHSGHHVFFHYEVFYCRCGVARSKQVMDVYREGVLPWFPSEPPLWSNDRRRCPKCGRMMRIIDHIPDRIRCDGCGHWMEPCNFIMFD